MLKRSYLQNPEKQKGGGVIQAPTAAALDFAATTHLHLKHPTPKLQLFIDFPAVHTSFGTRREACFDCRRLRQTDSKADPTSPIMASLQLPPDIWKIRNLLFGMPGPFSLRADVFEKFWPLVDNAWSKYDERNVTDRGIDCTSPSSPTRPELN